MRLLSCEPRAAIGSLPLCSVPRGVSTSVGVSGGSLTSGAMRTLFRRLTTLPLSLGAFAMANEEALFAFIGESDATARAGAAPATGVPERPCKLASG